jgi:hypothetical protein
MVNSKGLGNISPKSSFWWKQNTLLEYTQDALRTRMTSPLSQTRVRHHELSTVSKKIKEKLQQKRFNQNSTFLLICRNKKAYEEVVFKKEN